MITSYTELIAAIGNWLDRDDLATRAPEFIQLAEARLNRLLRDPDMQVIATLTASGAYTGLPSDFGRMVSISTGNGALQQTGAVEFASYDHSISGLPRRYSIIDGSIAFAPSNATTPITLVYERRLPPLASNATNWLLDRAPDVYLYGSLVQAEAFLVEDDRLRLWKAAFDEAISELKSDGDDRKWGSGPLAPRIRRP